jgi:cytoskeleton protein RodZ
VRAYLNEGKARVGSFGERLRREREMRGVSLDDIAEATKIGTRLLRALEEERFELLPGGIFNKGFVRAYAKYLGLNEEEAVADYLQAAGETIPDPRVIAEQNSTRIDRSGGDSDTSRPAGFPIIPVLILLLVIAAGAGGWQIYQDRQHDKEARREAAKSAALATPASAGANNPASATMPSNQPVAGNAANDTTSSKAAAPTGDIGKPNPEVVPGPLSSGNYSTANSGPYFEVTIRARDSAWVSIKSDGKFVVRGIIRPPDVKAIRANEQVVFFTGNAGAVEVSFNGQPVPLVGGPNKEGVLVFNSHGVVTQKSAQ